MRHLVLVLFSFVFSAPLLASNHILYECTDANGNRQFTNIPVNPKACKVLNIGPVAPPSPAAPAAPAAARRPPARPQVATPSHFPRVDRELQRRRDNDRLRILENELGTEERLLAQAKKELVEQESVRLGSEKNYQRVLERLEPYQKRVRLHEANIANLKREISKAR